MIDLEQSDGGVILPVKATPSASRNLLKCWRNGLLHVSVTVAAERGKANKALCAVIAKELGLRKSQVTLLSGQTSARKRFTIHGITARDLAARIQQRVDSELHNR